MARATGPLFSFDARGKLGNAIVFSNWKGRPTVRTHAVPANPKTAGQIAVRQMMSFLGKLWATLSAPQQASWNDLSVAGAYSPFNAMSSYNAKRFTQFTWPKVDPDQAAGTAPVLGTLTPTEGVGQLTLSQAVTTANGMIGVAFFLAASEMDPLTRDDTKLILPATAGPVTGVITGLAAGTYWLTSIAFNAGGTASNETTRQEVTIS